MPEAFEMENVEVEQLSENVARTRAHVLHVLKIDAEECRFAVFSRERSIRSP